ncbi:GNAT superfamily N-acetyltransferase [Psychromicrobium silvestre]|uniref:GNAT superfamily N-acetyltransferase n=1 Tax=Psychromicrobium silvestre TaxID=1645614 RepID=A0A7Y9LVQ3_9MICC|nr:GNAT family N-acetyltransferase [Psychromicrobium silvestre]NYE96490.1 GNAT superfamily N-acetyltransferase [Psychromicrobium silvestre]
MAELFTTALFTTPSGVSFRRATAADVPRIVQILIADQLGVSREGGDLAPYLAAFEAIDGDPAQLLVVGEQHGEVVATFQLSFIPGLARRGSLRAQLEAVRVADSLRGSGIGTQMVEWAIAESRRRGCSLVQLTTDKRRTAAHRFYQRLGFRMSHQGMKLQL